MQPTNDLDIATVEQLEQILQQWQGCVIVASHDRALLDTVAPRLLVLPGDGRVQLYDGRYSQVRLQSALGSRIPGLQVQALPLAGDSQLYTGHCFQPCLHDSGLWGLGGLCCLGLPGLYTLLVVGVA